MDNVSTGSTKRQFVMTWAATFIIISLVSIVWHVALFEIAYSELGVYSRINNPIFEFGVAAWLLESTVFVVLYFRSSWSRCGIVGGLKFSWLMACFVAATSVLGTAAKVQISDISNWVVLSGGFLVVLFTILGFVIGILSHRMNNSENQVA